MKFLLFVIVLVLAGIGISKLPAPQTARPETSQKAAPAPEPKPDPLADTNHLRWTACHMSQDYIRAALKAPATADFPRCTSPDVTYRLEKPGTYIVSTYVDAQNSFGAQLRGYYMCGFVTADGERGNVTCLETDADHKTTQKIF